MSQGLRITNLCAAYGHVPALRDVTLHVDAGEVVAVVGPNGAGKTTLLNTISGMVHPTGGEILFGDQDIVGWPAHRIMKAGISQVPEGSRPFGNMTVLENLQMGAYTNRAALKSGVLDEVYRLFPILEDRKGQYAKTLSGGQKQMLAIGRGLACRPSLLMLDEPSLGLAPKLVDDIYDRLRGLRDLGLTILLVEQNTWYALQFADRGYVLENGHVVMEGTGSELQHSEHIVEHYLGL